MMTEDGSEGLAERRAEDTAMEEDSVEEPASGKHKHTSELRSRVLSVLEERGLSKLRSAKLSQDDFLLLLSLFNKAGFHFA